MIAASNLGQIIGRLLYGEEVAGVRAEPPAAVEVPSKARRTRRGVPKLIVDLLGGHPEGLSAPVIAELCSIEPCEVYAAVGQMEEIEKSGARGNRIYKLKLPPP